MFNKNFYAFSLVFSLAAFTPLKPAMQALSQETSYNKGIIATLQGDALRAEELFLNASEGTDNSITCNAHCALAELYAEQADGKAGDEADALFIRAQEHLAEVVDQAEDTKTRQEATGALIWLALKDNDSELAKSYIDGLCTSCTCPKVLCSPTALFALISYFCHIEDYTAAEELLRETMTHNEDEIMCEYAADLLEAFVG